MLNRVQHDGVLQSEPVLKVFCFCKRHLSKIYFIIQKGVQPLKVIVPASTSNLGPGFDTLGLAVNKYMTIESSPSESFSMVIKGEGSADVPRDETNLVAVGMKAILKDLPPVKLSVKNDIPACGGFGASGAAIIGGLLLGSRLAGKKLRTEEIYNLAVRIEGHPDNVSAALFGGLVVNARGDNETYSHIRIPVNDGLKLVTILPDTKIETHAARKLLPDSVSLSEAVSNVQHSSLLVAAFGSGNYGMIKEAVRDELHEKYRKTLIPHFDRFSEAALKSGALAFTVSGAGSSCVAFCIRGHKLVQDAFEKLIRKLKLGWRTETLLPVNQGAEVLAK